MHIIDFMLRYSPITKEDLKKLNSIVNDLFDNEECEPFRVPVPFKRTLSKLIIINYLYKNKELQLHDYIQIIKKPMDFGTIKSNLKKNKYK